MNWLDRFKDILGRFWTDIFSEYDFTLGVKNLHALFALKNENMLASWYDGNIMMDNQVYDNKLPYVIYLVKSKTQKDAHGIMYVVPLVNHPAANLDNTLDEVGGLDVRDEHGGFAVASRFNIPVPQFMTDHVTGYTKTLFNLVDYEWKDGAFLFHFDPAELKLPEIYAADENGDIYSYWKIFGWCEPEESRKDAVCAFESEKLNPYAEVVWDIHQNGANYLNSKKLLGAVTGSVVCMEDGSVYDIWVEQHERCMLVNEKVYHADVDVSCNFNIGDSVKCGDVLFGPLKMLSSKDMPDDIPASFIPGVQVRTNIGELVAENREQASFPIIETRNDNTTVIGRVLPLRSSYTAPISEEYIELCRTNMTTPGCLSVDVPEIVNPFKFIFKKLRRGTGIFISITANIGSSVLAALSCIKKNMNASGVLSIYLQADGDIVNVASPTLSADAGNVAMAETVDITITEMLAEAEITV